MQSWTQVFKNSNNNVNWYFLSAYHEFTMFIVIKSFNPHQNLNRQVLLLSNIILEETEDQSWNDFQSFIVESSSMPSTTTAHMPLVTRPLGPSVLCQGQAGWGQQQNSGPLVVKLLECRWLVMLSKNDLGIEEKLGCYSHPPWLMVGVSYWNTS